MARMTVAECQKAIASLCKDCPDALIAQFSFSSRGEKEAFITNLLPETLRPRCWHFLTRFKSGDHYERIFDCIPFDQRLRAYVHTDIADTQIVSISLVGE